MQKRFVLWWLLLFLLVCNTFVTLNMNIAIVSMVNIQPSETTSNKSQTVCPNRTIFLSKDYLRDGDEFSSSIISANSGYNWSKAEQNMVLSGYFWLNYVSIMPGGILAHKYGSKRVVGYAQLISSAMSSLIPMTAGYGPLVVSCIRAVQGFLSFMSVPAGLFSIMGNWCPPHERGRFAANFMIGSSVGFTVGNFLFGYIGQYFHWRFIFHLTSVCGIVWSALWYLLVYDSPAQHISISIKEKVYIENSLKSSNDGTKAIIPWKGIITSIPLFVCILCASSFMWTWVSMATYSPVYLKSFYGLNSNEIGIITSVPNLVIGVLSIGLAYSSDLIIEKKLLTLTSVRKLCTCLEMNAHAQQPQLIGKCILKQAAIQSGSFFSSLKICEIPKPYGGIASAIPLLIIAFTRCNLILTISCLMISSIMKGFNTFGIILVVLDLSPKFSGILEGFSGSASSLLTFLFSTIVNYSTTIYDIETLWRMVFLYTALYSIFTTAMFLIFGTSEVQSWNFKYEEREDNELKE